MMCLVLFLSFLTLKGCAEIAAESYRLERQAWDRDEKRRGGEEGGGEFSGTSSTGKKSDANSTASTNLGWLEVVVSWGTAGSSETWVEGSPPVMDPSVSNTGNGWALSPI